MTVSARSFRKMGCERLMVSVPHEDLASPMITHTMPFTAVLLTHEHADGKSHLRSSYPIF